ncbi:hypothetical protein HMI56_004442, partial [Coelomomyces lativittatus]
MEKNNIIQQNLKLVDLFFFNFNVTFPETLKNEDCPENKFCLIIANTYSFEVQQNSIDLDKKYSMLADPVHHSLSLQLKNVPKNRNTNICHFKLQDKDGQPLYHLASCFDVACTSPMHIQFSSIDKCETWKNLYSFERLTLFMHCTANNENNSLKVPIFFNPTYNVDKEKLFNETEAQTFLNAREFSANPTQSFFIALDA